METRKRKIRSDESQVESKQRNVHSKTIKRDTYKPQKLKSAKSISKVIVQTTNSELRAAKTTAQLPCTSTDIGEGLHKVSSANNVNEMKHKAKKNSTSKRRTCKQKVDVKKREQLLAVSAQTGANAVAVDVGVIQQRIPETIPRAPTPRPVQGNSAQTNSEAFSKPTNDTNPDETTVIYNNKKVVRTVKKLAEEEQRIVKSPVAHSKNGTDLAGQTQQCVVQQSQGCIDNAAAGHDMGMDGFQEEDDVSAQDSDESGGVSEELSGNSEAEAMSSDEDAENSDEDGESQHSGNVSDGSAENYTRRIDMLQAENEQLQAEHCGDSVAIQRVYRLLSTSNKQLRRAQENIVEFLQFKRKRDKTQRMIYFGQHATRRDVLEKLILKHGKTPTTFFPRLCEVVFGREYCLAHTMMGYGKDEFEPDLREDLIAYAQQICANATEKTLKNAFGTYRARKWHQEKEKGVDFVVDLTSVVDLERLAKEDC